MFDKKVICCGTVIGSVDAMKIFCRMMWETLKDTKLWGHEQGAMNYFVHNELLPIDRLIEIDTNSGAILTNGVVHEDKFRDDKILRGDGGVPAVVHQYDRHPPQVQLVDKIYRDRNFQAEEDFEEPRSNLEQVKQLLYLGKFNDAARFYLEKLSEGADFGGNSELLLKLWETALNRPLTPAVGCLELAAQNALASVGIPFQRLNGVGALLSHAIKTRRPVNQQFVLYVAGVLLKIAERSLMANAAAQCFACLDLVTSFELPPNKDFYLLQAKANRTFGHKEAALAAYKKLLEFD